MNIGTKLCLESCGVLVKLVGRVCVCVQGCRCASMLVTLDYNDGFISWADVS